jgi:hypothetical protein
MHPKLTFSNNEGKRRVPERRQGSHLGCGGWLAAWPPRSCLADGSQSMERAAAAPLGRGCNVVGASWPGLHDGRGKGAAAASGEPGGRGADGEAFLRWAFLFFSLPRNGCAVEIWIEERERERGCLFGFLVRVGSLVCLLRWTVIFSPKAMWTRNFWVLVRNG